MRSSAGRQPPLVRPSRTLDALAVAAFKVGVSGLVLAAGVRAISDDDFARVVIAQRFVAEPSLDPSGTSWLPLPFWLLGAPMAVFGRTLEVARVAAFVTGVVAAVLVWQAGSWLRLSRRGALIGAMLAAALPWFAWTGVTTTPEALTAALTLVGAASLTGTGRARRWLGGAALCAACLSRYEPWPVAAVFAALCVYDAARLRSAALVGAALIALSGPIAWLVHGQFVHGDPGFFIARVTAYKRALGGAESSLLSRALSYPLALIKEPEVLSVPAALLAAGTAPRRLWRKLWPRTRRLLLCFAALLAFLVLGAVRGGVPTHHLERALLLIWLGIALISGELLATLFEQLRRRSRRLSVLVIVFTALLATSMLRRSTRARESFAARTLEVDIGKRAARQLASSPGKLLIDTPDYGYFAVIAGFGEPERAEPLAERTPGAQSGARTPPEDVLLRRRVHEVGAAWLITSASRSFSGARSLERTAENSRFVLLRLALTAQEL